MFSEAETQYLKSQRLARIATVSSKGQPDVVPVGFEFNGKIFLDGEFQQNEVDLVTLSVPAAEIAAIKLYGKMGFELRAQFLWKRLAS